MLQTLVEKLKGKILIKYGLKHKCGTFMATEKTYADLCCCNYDWCNKLKVNESPVIMDGKKGWKKEEYGKNNESVKN